MINLFPKIISKCCAYFLIFASSLSSAKSDLALVYELALSNDPNIKASKANYLANSEIKNQARSLLLPNLQANASYSKTDQKSESRRYYSTTPTELNLDLENEITFYNLSITQNLFNLQAFFSYKESIALAGKAELAHQIDKQLLILRTAESYFNVLRNKETLASTIAEERAIKKQYEKTKQLYENGLTSITGVHESRAAFDMIISKRLIDEVNLEMSYENLFLLTGKKHHLLKNLSNIFESSLPLPNDIEKWVDFSAKNNLEIKFAQKTLEASQQHTNSKKSEHAPTIQASLRYDDNDSNTIQTDRLTSSSLPDAFSYSSGSTIEIKMNLPLWSSGKKNSERRQAHYIELRDREKLKAKKQEVFKKTRSLFLQTVSDIAKINASKNAKISAQSALDSTQTGYNLGSRNIVDLLNAQRDLYQAERNLSSSRYDYILNSLRLKQMAGTLIEEDLYTLNKLLE